MNSTQIKDLVVIPLIIAAMLVQLALSAFVIVYVLPFIGNKIVQPKTVECIKLR